MYDLKKLWSALEKYKYPLLVLLIGVILMLIPSGEAAGKKGGDAETEFSALLSSIDGVGEARVLVSDSGVVVVCRGADKAGVRLDLINAIRSYTGFGSDRITILKLKA